MKITLSSNASKVPFEHLQYYLNKKEKFAKQGCMNGELIKNSRFKKVLKRFSMRVLGDFSKKCNYLFDLTNFPVAL